MTIPTETSLSGFIATEPILTATRTGVARVYIRVGKEYWGRNENGHWEQTQEATFHDLELYGNAAVAAHKQFRPGDRFVAEGEIRTYEREANGKTDEVDVFRARKLGHESARTSYAVRRNSQTAGIDHDQGRTNARTTGRQASGVDEDGEDPPDADRARRLPPAPSGPAPSSSAAPSEGLHV
jgi:single-strand DNA-binding protein